MRKFSLSTLLIATAAFLAHAEQITISTSEFASISGNVASDGNVGYTVSQNTASHAPYVDKSHVLHAYAGSTLTVAARNGAVLNTIVLDVDGSMSYTIDGTTTALPTASTTTLAGLNASQLQFTATSDITVSFMSVEYDNASVSTSTQAPAFTHASGAYNVSQCVYVSNYDNRSDYYYTLDGSALTTASSNYIHGNGIDITATSTLKMIAVKDGESSPVSQADYAIATDGGQLTWSQTAYTTSTVLSTTSEVMAMLSGGSEYIRSIDDITNAAASQYGLGLGTSTAAGKMTINLKTSWNISKITFMALGGKNNNGGNGQVKITVNDKSQKSATLSHLTKYQKEQSFTYDGSPVSSITIETQKGVSGYRVDFQSIKIYTENAGEMFLSLADLAQSCNDYTTSSTRTYTINSQVHAVAHYHNYTTGNDILLVKDSNGESVSKSTNASGLPEYLINATSSYGDDYNDVKTNSTSQLNYDQSNWMEIVIPSSMSTEAASQLVGTYIAPGQISGTLISTDINPQLSLSTSALAMSGEASDYSRNAMTPANFIRQTDYFFMLPKPCEYVQVVWAMYDEDSSGNGTFNCPPQSDGVNTLGISGKVTPKWNYMTATPTLVPGTSYQFKAIAKRRTQNVDSSDRAPRKDVSNKSSIVVGFYYEIYPLDLDPEREGVVTAVTGIETTRQVTRVSFYSPQGLLLPAKQPGVNIVVTHYNDGSSTTSKVLY